MFAIFLCTSIHTDSEFKLFLLLFFRQVSNIPTALFFPVPMSSRISLDVRGSKLSSLGPQLLNTLESKQRRVDLRGLSTNPVFCDCNARALRRWLAEKKFSTGGSDDMESSSDMGDVRCAAPEPLAGKLLSALPEEELTCEGRATTTTTELEFVAEDVTVSPNDDGDSEDEEDEELDIITSEDALNNKRGNKKRRPPPGSRGDPLKTAGSANAGTPYNMDALIIGIVGGVVAFIAIIIVIICVVRLRLTDSQYRGGPLAGPLALRAQGKCTCLKPGPPTIYNGATNGSVANGAGYALSYPSTPVPPHHAPPLALTWGGAGHGGTINSQKMLPPPPAPSLHGSTFGTVGAHSYAGTVVSRAGE